MRQLTESGGGLSEALANAQQEALTSQSQSFQASKNSLNQSLQEKLYQKQLDRSVQAQQARNQQQLEQANRTKNNALYGQVGSVAGLVGGTLVSSWNPLGGVSGAQVGQTIDGVV